MLNNVNLIGRLTKDPELRTAGGSSDSPSVAKFTLAVDRPIYGDKEKQTDFIPVTVWRSTAEFVGRNFHKGKQVYVFGRLQTRSWEKDGQKYYGFEVSANEVGFADAVKKQEGGQAAQGAPSGYPNNNAQYQQSGYSNTPNGFPQMASDSSMGDFMPDGFDPFDNVPNDNLPM
jgi:single-strand DNA-binding protein